LVVAKQTEVNQMNLQLLYQWTAEIDKRLVGLGRWQKRTLALFSYGVVLAQSCTLSRVALHLTSGKSSTVERRLQRWLDNDRLVMRQLFPLWVKWVLGLWGEAGLLILVDETKLSDHVAVMMVGLCYRASAIPLVWRAYNPQDYPEEGQVEVLRQLLAQLRAVLPAGRNVVILADRGLGTSPTWQTHLMQQGWDYLLRVQRSTHIRLPNGKTQPLGRLVSYGQTWTGRGEVFKKAGWHWKQIYVVWEYGYAEPWCLLSNSASLSPMLYARRFHHEASFRDLKSDGFQWQRSRVWLPDHTERLLLVLALAMLWSLAEGTWVLHLYPLTRRQQRLSVFRLGSDHLFSRLRQLASACLELFLVPDTPILKTVVP
jgi:hypothetical protein